MYGSAINLAATLATAGEAGAATRAARVGTAAAVGAASGVGGALNENKGAADVVKSGVLGGVLGGAATLGTELASAGAKKVAKNAAEEIYNRIIKTPKAQVAAGREAIGTGLLKRGISGSIDKMEGTLRTATQKNKQILTGIIEKNAEKPVEVSSVMDSLEKLRTKLRNTPGEGTGPVDSVIQAIDSIHGGSGKIPLAQAQELKQNLQSAVSDAFLRQNVTGATQAQKTAAQELRLAIEKAVPEVKAPNKELEFAARAVKRLTEQGNLSPSKLRLFAEAGLAVYGAKDTYDTGKVSPILGTIAAERLLTNPSTATRIGQVLQKGAGGINKKAASVLQKAVANSLGRASAKRGQ